MTAANILRQAMKTCTCCGSVLPLSEFYAEATGADGHRNQCRICIRTGAIRQFRLARSGRSSYSDQKPEGTALARTPTFTGTYDGAELRPYTGRPGALDAYRLPSRGL